MYTDAPKIVYICTQLSFNFPKLQIRQCLSLLDLTNGGIPARLTLVKQVLTRTSSFKNLKNCKKKNLQSERAVKFKSFWKCTSSTHIFLVFIEE
mmetsp:Transcript_37563/g.99985  ORF Transcript_37563/g.99985 Transcript_37563/m.99985 type:complete len:94 (-) Transcript_37563:336-617(-)